MLNLWNPAGRRERWTAANCCASAACRWPACRCPLLLEQTAAAPRPASRGRASFGKAKNCIILYLSGGPAQLDTFDPKPDAPDDIRGEFSTIPTAVPGVRFSELLPHGREVDAQVGLVRTMYHDAQRPRPRLLLDVHRLPVSRLGAATSTR